MAVLILLLAMHAFLLWAIAHTHRRINWYQDEVDAEAFLAALKDFQRAVLSAAEATYRLAAVFQEAASQPGSAASSPEFESPVDAAGLEWVDIDDRTFDTRPDYS